MSEVDDSKRKTSDILLNIEKRLLELTQVIQAQDLNLKLILNKLNEGKKEIQGRMTSIQASSFEKSQISTPRPETPSIELKKENKTSKRKVKDESVSKVPVLQRITDQNGKDLFMADVLITDLDTNELVNRSKTNAQGKWQAYLIPGNYSIYISKMSSDGVNKIESLQEVEVTPGSKALQLPTAIIKR